MLRVGFDPTTSCMAGRYPIHWTTKTTVNVAEQAVFISQWTPLIIRLAKAGKKVSSFFKENSFYVFGFLYFSVQIRRDSKIDPERAFPVNQNKTHKSRLKQEII